MAREDYSVTIKETAKGLDTLSARERIMLKDTSSAHPLDETVSDEAGLMITPVDYAVLEIHNEKATGDKDYQQYLIMDENGEKYTTGSNAFWNSFSDIWNEMNGEAFTIKVYRKPSKNYTGKSFLTCSIQ